MHYHINESECRLMDILWDAEPFNSMELAGLCRERLGWKKSTTYTILRSLGEKQIVRNENAIVRTPDSLIYAEVPLISNYEIEPLIQEQDFDNDGKEELAIITYVLHGTGSSIRSLFMADRTSDNSWNIYHYLEEDYTKELTSHFDTQYTQEELAGYSNINHTGNYPGHELEACLNYMGDGKWGEFTYLNYTDAGITELIENAIPLYLTGQTEEVNEYYIKDNLVNAVPVFALPYELIFQLHKAM